jgi:nitrous oxidase accessory protein NosD
VPAPNPTFNTIQAAVIAADPGDIVKVCPGTYTENVTVNKALILRGAKAGVDARTRAATNESEDELLGVDVRPDLS